MRSKRLLYLLLALMPVFAFAQSKQLIRLLPDHLNAQFAGGIGFVSVGAGYETRNHRWHGDFYYGYVPESVGGIEIHSVTAKLTWAAASSQLRKDVRVDWVTAGVLANYVFGKQYFLFDPDRYPYSYYGFPTAAHIGMSVGSAVYHGRFGLYYELGTTDRFVVSYIRNTHSLSFFDIMHLGIGMKYSILGHDWQRASNKKAT